MSMSIISAHAAYVSSQFQGECYLRRTIQILCYVVCTLTDDNPKISSLTFSSF